MYIGKDSVVLAIDALGAPHDYNYYRVSMHACMQCNSIIVIDNKNFSEVLCLFL